MDSARTAFEWLVTGPDPLSIEGRFFPGLPRRRVPLNELRELLLDPGVPLPTVDLVWMHLVARSRDEGGTWTVACVGMALPALFAIAAELSAPFADDPRDIHAAVLTGFLSELATINLARPWVLWRLRCAALRAGHLFIRDALERPLPTGEDFGSSEPTPPWGHPDFVLARAVAEGAITREEAELIGSTRLEDYSLSAAAADAGVNVTTLQWVRGEAEARLVAWLSEQAPHDDPGDRRERDVEIRAVNAATLAAAANSIDTATGTGLRRPAGKSRRVTTSTEKLSVTVRYRTWKKAPESGVGGCGRTPAAPAHTTPLDRPTGTTRRPPSRTEDDSGGAAMRLTRSPVGHQHDHRRSDRRPRRGPVTPPLAPPFTVARRARHRRSRASRPTTDTPTASPMSAPMSSPPVGRRTTVRRRLMVIAQVAVLTLVLTAPASTTTVAHADTMADGVVLAIAGSVDEVLTNIRNWLMGIVAALATVFLTIGGVRRVFGGGDPGEQEKAKDAFKAAGIGYGLAALAPLVVTVLKGIVGA